MPCLLRIMYVRNDSAVPIRNGVALTACHVSQVVLTSAQAAPGASLTGIHGLLAAAD